MSRENKFRGIKKGTNDFIYGSLVSDKKQGVAILQQLNNPINYGAANGWCFAIEPESVGQFTGLKDKNGVEIYEGDILQHTVADYHKRAGQVFKNTVEYYNGNICGWRIINKSFHKKLTENWLFNQDAEVIGHIHTDEIDSYNSNNSK